MKITFTKDYSPRKKGEIFIAETFEEIQLANFYLSIQVAKKCDCSKTPNGCVECGKKADDITAVVGVKKAQKSK